MIAIDIINNFSGLETERLHFRKLTPNDFEPWQEFYKSPEALKYLGKEVDDLAQSEFLISGQIKRYEDGRGGLHAVCLKESKEMIGICGLLYQEVDEIMEWEIGYHFLPRFWGKGYASEAAMACRDYAFEHDLSESVVSIVGILNLPSASVAGRNGMKIEKQSNFKGFEVNIYRIWKYEVNE